MQESERQVRLEQAVRASRTLSADGSRVVYDLTRGVDFSRPGATAWAIAKVLWEEDVHAWWSLQDGKPVCAPTRPLELRLRAEHNRKVAMAVRGFRKDLRDYELKIHLAGYLDSVSDYSTGWPMATMLGPQFQFAQVLVVSKEQKHETDRLFSLMSRNLRVVIL